MYQLEVVVWLLSGRLPTQCPSRSMARPIGIRSKWAANHASLSRELGDRYYISPFHRASCRAIKGKVLRNAAKKWVNKRYVSWNIKRNLRCFRFPKQTVTLSTDSSPVIVRISSLPNQRGNLFPLRHIISHVHEAHQIPGPCTYISVQREPFKEFWEMPTYQLSSGGRRTGWVGWQRYQWRETFWINIIKYSMVESYSCFMLSSDASHSIWTLNGASMSSSPSEKGIQSVWFHMQTLESSSSLRVSTEWNLQWLGDRFKTR